MVSFRVAAGRAYSWLVLFPVFVCVAIIGLTGIARMLDWMFLVGAFTVLAITIQIVTAVFAFLPKVVGGVAVLGAILGLIVPGWKTADASGEFVKFYAKALGFYGAFLGLGVMAVNILPLHNHPYAFVIILLGVLTLGYMAMAGILPVEKTDWGKKAAMVVGAFIAINIAMTVPGVRDGTILSVMTATDNTHPGKRTRTLLEKTKEIRLANFDKEGVRALEKINTKLELGKTLTEEEVRTLAALEAESHLWNRVYTYFRNVALRDPAAHLLPLFVGLIVIIAFVAGILRAVLSLGRKKK